MSGFYADLSQAAVDLLTADEAGGLGATAGSITLTRTTITPPANSWESPTTSTATETLKAQAFGVSAEFIGMPAQEPDNGVVLASDVRVICAMPSGGYKPGDLISIDGKPVTVIRSETIPAAGTPVALRFIVRG